MLLEDELGQVNLIVPPEVYERHRAIVRGEPLLLVRGRFERVGENRNIVVSELETLGPLARGDRASATSAPRCRRRTTSATASVRSDEWSRADRRLPAAARLRGDRRRPHDRARRTRRRDRLALLAELDSPPVLDRLLDAPNGGCFELAPDQPFESIRRYRDGTNVLETTFTTATGSVRVTDAMTLGESESRALVRIVDAREGSVPMRWRFEPRFDFGRGEPPSDLTLRTWDAGERRASSSNLDARHLRAAARACVGEPRRGRARARAHVGRTGWTGAGARATTGRSASRSSAARSR